MERARRLSDLIRHLRHGGPAALAAAKQLLEAKPKLSPAEIAEVKLLLPQLKDLFGAKLSEGLSTLLSGLEVAVPVPVETLMPRLEQLKDPKQLPARFATDLQLVRPQLVNHPVLTREQKATRLFSFLLPFLAKTVALPAAQREEVAPKLLEHAAEAGFKQLEDKPTKRDGVEVARQLLQQPTPERVHEAAKALQLDAPAWPETAPAPAPARPGEAPQRMPEEPARMKEGAGVRPDDAPAEREGLRSQGPASSTPLTSTQLQQQRRSEQEAAKEAAAARTNKRLGPQMLWNVLHLFRDDGHDGRDSASQREAMNQLVVGMALALGLLTLIAVLVLLIR